MDREERADLVARLFVLMTCKLEDAAGDAVDGQGKGGEAAEQVARADRIELIARDLGLLAEAAAAILREQSPDA